MIRIGILGDIGSGKSFVAKQFGYPVFNADKEVGEIYKKSKKCYMKLKKVLPKDIISFPIDKREISKAIIGNSNNIKKIISIVHPEVRTKMNYFISKNKKKRFVILDIHLLMEKKLNKKKDILIFVDAKKKEINKRLLKRPNFKPKIVEKLKILQLPLEYKKKKSHFIIKNYYNKNATKKIVKIILKEILLNARGYS